MTKTRALAALAALLTVGVGGGRAHAWLPPATLEDQVRALVTEGEDSPQSPEPGERASAPGLHAGLALEHTPADCETLAYADVAAIGALAPVKEDAPLVRERLVALLASRPALHERARSAAAALSQRQIDWGHDVAQVAVCADRNHVRSVAIAGRFEGKDVLDAVLAVGNGHVERTTHGDRAYAEAPGWTVAQVEPNVVVLGRDLAAVDASWSAGEGLVSRGGAEEDLLLFETSRVSNRHVVTETTATGDALVVASDVLNLDGPYDAVHDRPAIQARIDRAAERLRRSPLAAAADDVQRTTMLIDGDRVRVRTVVPLESVRAAIATAARSQKADWGPLLEGLGPMIAGSR